MGGLWKGWSDSWSAGAQVAMTAGQMTEGRPGGKPMRICGLARANEKDIERCYNAVKHAPLHRIHTFLASSDIHLEHKLGITRAQCLETAYNQVGPTCQTYPSSDQRFHAG